MASPSICIDVKWVSGGGGGDGQPAAIATARTNYACFIKSWLKRQTNTTSIIRCCCCCCFFFSFLFNFNWGRRKWVSWIAWELIVFECEVVHRRSLSVIRGMMAMIMSISRCLTKSSKDWDTDTDVTRKSGWTSIIVSCVSSLSPVAINRLVTTMKRAKITAQTSKNTIWMHTNSHFAFLYFVYSFFFFLYFSFHSTLCVCIVFLRAHSIAAAAATSQQWMCVDKKKKICY